jgi:hypothetical protein
VTLDRAHVIAHAQIDSINRATDPYCCVNIENVLKGLNAPVADAFCCEQPYGGRYNVTKQQWEWRPDALFIWRAEDPVWRCASGCP